MTQATSDYSAFKGDTTPTNPAMAKLYDLVDQVRELEAELVELGDNMKKKQEVLRDLLWNQIPTLMDNEIGVDEVKIPDGSRISIKEDIDAGISAERKPVAHTWLEANGHGGLIKREVTVAFNREQEEAAGVLVKELQSRFAGVGIDSKVHPATLKAWAKEMLAKGSDFPLELFGIFRRRIAKIQEPKKKAG